MTSDCNVISLAPKFSQPVVVRCLALLLEYSQVSYQHPKKYVSNVLPRHVLVQSSR